ncbi:ATP-binding protein [Donghicola sp. XS_ASV15]|uniref:sensor histidine kinase n=1 Tax=Donghicola sp. XS_ASV15 TaxID=3241295 RepID=UPI003511945E
MLAALVSAGLVSATQEQRVQHLTARISQASAQVAALEILGRSLHDELFKAVLEPDLQQATDGLDQFERDAMHALGILEQLTAIEIDFVHASEQAEESAERTRPAMLREAAVAALTAGRRVVNLRQSADIMQDTTSALEQLNTERANISQIVSAFLEDEQNEILRASDAIARAQQKSNRWITVLLGLALASWGAAIWVRGREQTLRESRRTEALSALAQNRNPEPLDDQDPIGPALTEVSERMDAIHSAQSRTRQDLEERTAALQLSATKLKQIDETRRRFLADLGHSLKTPLAIARGSIEALSEDRTKREAALDAVDQVTRRVSDLLQLARSDDGRLLRQSQLLELTELLDNRVAEMAALPQGDWITLTTDDQGPYEIEGDREALTRMFDAIIENGLRYATETSPLVIHLSAAPQTVTVSISDQGPGVTQGQVVFDRDTSFYQGGTGIGLAMARQIAQDHGGHIALIDAGGGARFDISLPQAGSN